MWIFALTVSLTLAQQRSGVLKHLQTLRPPLKAATQVKWEPARLLLMLHCIMRWIRRALRVPAAQHSSWRSTPCARAIFTLNYIRNETTVNENEVSLISIRVLLLWGQKFEHPEVSYCHSCACFQNKSHQYFCFHSWLLEEVFVWLWSCPDVISTRECIVFNSILLWWNKI